MGGYCRVLGKKELGAGRGGRGLDSYNLGFVRPAEITRQQGCIWGSGGPNPSFLMTPK